MAISINIRGTVITFPTSGTAANWSEPVVEFAQAVEEALDLAIGTYDIPPTSMDIDANNGASNVSITGLSFDTNEVKSAEVTISVYRNTTSPNATYTQTNIITIDYNDTRSTNEKWNIAQMRLGDAGLTFDITDSGQMRFTSDSKSGVHTGYLVFSAKTLETA